MAGVLQGISIMKFALSVQGGPYQSQSALSALRFAEAVLAGGHELYRVFFYHDGVITASRLGVVPQDEFDIHLAWVTLAKQHDIALVVCIASALRRGILNHTEADRYEKAAFNLHPQFIISGLGQLIDASLEADRLVTFP